MTNCTINQHKRWYLLWIAVQNSSREINLNHSQIHSRKERQCSNQNVVESKKLNLKLHSILSQLRWQFEMSHKSKCLQNVRLTRIDTRSYGIKKKNRTSQINHTANQLYQNEKAKKFCRPWKHAENAKIFELGALKKIHFIDSVNWIWKGKQLLKKSVETWAYSLAKIWKWINSTNFDLVLFTFEPKYSSSWPIETLKDLKNAWWCSQIPIKNAKNE